MRADDEGNADVDALGLLVVMVGVAGVVGGSKGEVQAGDECDTDVGALGLPVGSCGGSDYSLAWYELDAANRLSFKLR